MNKIEIKDFKYISNNINANKLEGKIFLITGANGFIASYLTKYILFLNQFCLKNRCKIYVLCRNRQKLFERFAGYDIHDLVIIEQDVTEKIEIFDNIDFIVHAASISATNLFSSKPVDVSLANSVGTYQVLEYARKTKVESVLFFSSGAVYGEIPKGIDAEISEKQYYNLEFNNIRNCYTEGKRFGEQLMMDYYSQYKVPSKIVRISHTYGPGIDLNDGHVYSDFVKAILQNRDIHLKGDGTPIRPFCYIADAIVAFLLIILEGSSGKVYNMANNNCNFSIYQLANILVNMVDSKKKIRGVVRKIEATSEKKNIKLDIGELQALGWNPQIGVEEGFLNTIESFKCN